MVRPPKKPDHQEDMWALAQSVVQFIPAAGGVIGGILHFIRHVTPTKSERDVERWRDELTDEHNRHLSRRQTLANIDIQGGQRYPIEIDSFGVSSVTDIDATTLRVDFASGFRSGEDYFVSPSAMPSHVSVEQEPNGFTLTSEKPLSELGNFSLEIRSEPSKLA